jgi:hypothetical protein
MTLTPLSVTNSSPGLVTSQLPPVAAAKSTMTEPGFMLATISAVISFGAGLPGIAAVVMMISTSFACSAKSFISAAMNSSLITLA